VATVLEGVGSLEEQLLRVLYDRSVSARECAAELSPYARITPERLLEIEFLLRVLAQHAYLAVEIDPVAVRYSLTSAGSERLAQLVE
jgi:hypothetical protein